jgi:hypothetical protein
MYQISLPDDVEEINEIIEFAKPEMIKTEMEMLEVAAKEIELGLTSRVHVLMKLKGMTKEEAQKHIQEVDQYAGIV